MHTKTIEINVFDVGDYVLTPRGKGFIVEVNENLREVTVQHKSGDEDNPENLPKTIEDIIPFLISKEEYDL